MGTVKIEAGAPCRRSGWVRQASVALFVALLATGGCERTGGELRDMPYFGEGEAETGEVVARESEDERTPGVSDSEAPAPSLPNDPREAIRRAAIEYVRVETEIEEVDVEIQAIAGNWARVRVVPAGELTDPAILYLRYEDGRWRGVVLGTAFMPDDLARLGIPPEVRPE